jgi:DHA3 family tetracycline resistance protein-like MFS transporter
MLSVFANRDFALYWLGSTVSLLGDGVYFVAIAWKVYQLSNTPSALAYIGVAWTLPQLASLLFTGAISDRFDRRRLMMIANALSGAAIGAIALLTLAGLITLWQLWILVAVHGIGVALFIPAAGAFVPEVIPTEQLVEANALRQFVRPLTMRLVGPALGGLLVAALGAGEAFLFDSLSFFFAVAALGLVRARRHAGASPSPTSVTREVAAGLQFVRSQSWLWLSLLATSAWLLIYVGPLETLLPFLVKNKIGTDARGLGLVFAAGGLGAMAFAYTVAQKRLPRRALVLMYTLWSLSMFALASLALAHALWQAMLSSFFIFGLLSTGEIVWQTMLQTRVPNQLLGRVASVDWFVSAALVPLSFVLAGPIAGAVGATRTILGAGILGGVLMAALIALPPIHGSEPVEHPQLAGA